MVKIDYDKTIYYMTLALAFSMPLSRAMISALVVLLILFWILEKDFKDKYRQIVSSRLLVAISIYLLFSAISVIWSSNIDEALNMMRLNIYWLVIFVIATKIKKEQINSIINAFLIGMFISEFIAYGVFFELWKFKYATVGNPSPFMFWIDYSVFMAFTSLLLLNRIFSKNYTFKEKIMFVFFFTTVTGNLFLAIGRTGQVAFIAGVLVLMIMRYRFTFKSIFMTILTLGIILTTAYSISNTFKMRTNVAIEDIKNISNMNFEGSWGIRVAYWITSYHIFKEHPVIGVGVGDFQDETKKLLQSDNYPYLNSETKEFMSNHHPHNQFLLVAMQMGVVGLVLFIYMIYQIIRLKIKDREIKELSILFVTVFFVSCFAEPLLLKQFTLVLFILFVGLFATQEQKI